MVEGLRVVANLTKRKDVIKHLMSLNYHKALFLLLEHQSDEVVYNSLGCLINISNSESIYEQEIIQSLFQSIKKIYFEDESIFMLIFKLISNILNFI